MPPVADPIDVEALLAAIPGESPAGEDLRHTLYDEIKEARRADDGLAQGVWQHDVKSSDWAFVVKRCTDALATKTKDINVGAWLAEALVHEKGLAGLRSGLSLLTGLLDRYWDSAYPEIDPETPGEEFLARANSLEDFDRKVAAAVMEVPLTRTPQVFNFTQVVDSEPYDLPGVPLGTADAEASARLMELKEKATAEGKPSGDDLRRSREATPKAFYVDATALLGECRQSLGRLQEKIDEKFQKQAFGLREVDKCLAEISEFLARTLKEKRILDPDPIEASGEEVAGEPGAEGAPAGGAGAGGVGGGSLRGREDALKRLEDVAAFFRRTEPHSPVPFLVLRAVSWGRMPLDGWLAEVVKDGATLEQIRETLGLRPGASE